MKKLWIILALFIFLIKCNAQIKYWLSGHYAEGKISYINNGKPEKLNLYWENDESFDNKDVLVYGNFEVDEKGVDYFYVLNSSPQVNLYKGTALKRKFSCAVNSDEGQLTIDNTGKKVDFVSFIQLPKNSNINVKKANWGLKTCDGKRYSIYYIEEIDGFPANNSSSQNSSSTQTNANSQQNPGSTDNNSSISFTGSEVSIPDAEAALAFHNKSRAEVGVEPLSWSAEISAFAQKWANNLAATNNCNLSHRPRTGEWAQIYGENAAGMSSNPSPALSSSKMWYKEIKDFKNDNWWPSAAHYSQMVWRKSKLLGMGSAKCSNGNYVVIANYNPGGNMSGEPAY